ncbi:MAG: TRAP transporter permease [Deltaproteobacteria bacterium]|nr:TRAP transporter permease [Candidatus Anaeroferrophillus wilburensis]MBN2890208.1 TRAP transporter permease [Deltaproteobacteria bacterium]
MNSETIVIEENTASSRRNLRGLTALFITATAVGLSLFQLYTAGIAPLAAIYQRSVHLTLIMVLVFALYPPIKAASQNRVDLFMVLDWLLILLTLTIGAYIWIEFNSIVERQGDWTTTDVVMGTIALLLLLEATRRVIGFFMAAIAIIFLLFTYFGPWMPEMLAHKGYSIERIVTTLYLTTEGIWGLPTGVAATFVFVFILFGSFLELTGGGDFFIDLAYSLTGRLAGGPAKTAILASGFMGSVSGSAVANVVTTGSFTIPMMKKVGYKPHIAGAIEAAASTGGQIMPPIMGAGAFLMAEFTNTSYLYIVKIAIVPAILYYLSVFFFVHFEAKKEGFKPMAKADLPAFWPTMKNGLHFLLPVIILIYVLFNNYSPMMAGFVAVVSTLATSMLRRATRLNFKEIIAGLETGARNAMMVSVACGCAGIIVGCVSLTGLGLKFSSLVVSLSAGSPLLAIILIGLASLVLGMGLPVTASYIVLVILAGPALMDLGLPIIVAHMIVFWYSQDANVTPPVSLASFAGAGIAGASPLKTGFASWKIAKGLYVIPIVMAYRPLLGNGPPMEVILTMLFTTLGLVAFTSFLERFLIKRLNIIETILMGSAALGLLWPHYGISAGGALLLAGLAGRQWLDGKR